MTIYKIKTSLSNRKSE